METNVIAITRQFGSLGRNIAKMIAKELGYKYYDRDIIESAAEQMGEDVEALSEYDGQMKSSIYGKMIYPLGNGGYTKQEKLFDIEKKIILDLAQKNNCVIVGRCADYILKEAKCCNLLSVFVYAPYSARYYFSLNNFGLTSDAVMEYIDKVDKARNQFYRHYTGEKFESVKYRDLMIDSSSGEIEDVVETICFYAKKKFEV